jgi:hypothetical protein
LIGHPFDYSSARAFLPAIDGGFADRLHLTYFSDLLPQVQKANGHAALPHCRPLVSTNGYFKLG